MFFIGIDVGKRNSEVTLIDKKRINVEKTIRITNTKIFPNGVKTCTNPFRSCTNFYQ